ncbi:MAG: hypothetical protein Tsb0014_33690 [Pleurocapsa sp.]
MIHLISQTISTINSWLKKIQVKSFLSTILLGAILLTSGVSSYATNGANAADDISSKVFEGNSERPTTTREWRQEARQTEDAPLERAKEIGKETAQAIKEWGELYPDVAERTIPDQIN